MMFFESYYRQGELLPDEERLKLYDHILRFYFDDIEGELDGLANLVWVGIKPILERSKETETKSSEGGKKSRKQKDKQAETKNISTLKTKNISTLKTKNITEGRGGEKEKDKDINNPLTPLEGENDTVSNRNFSPTIEEAVMDWLAYKKEKRQSYKPTGLRSFLTTVENKIKEHGEIAVADVIRLSMSNNWQGVIWDRIKKGAENGTGENAKGWGKDLDKDPYAYWK